MKEWWVEEWVMERLQSQSGPEVLLKMGLWGEHCVLSTPHWAAHSLPESSDSPIQAPSNLSNKVAYSCQLISPKYISTVWRQSKRQTIKIYSSSTKNVDVTMNAFWLRDFCVLLPLKCIIIRFWILVLRNTINSISLLGNEIGLTHVQPGSPQFRYWHVNV